MVTIGIVLHEQRMELKREGGSEWKQKRIAFK